MGDTITDDITPMGVNVPKSDMVIGVVQICAPTDADKEDAIELGIILRN